MGRVSDRLTDQGWAVSLDADEAAVVQAVADYINALEDCAGRTTHQRNCNALWLRMATAEQIVQQCSCGLVETRQQLAQQRKRVLDTMEGQHAG